MESRTLNDVLQDRSDVLDRLNGLIRYFVDDMHQYNQRITNFLNYIHKYHHNKALHFKGEVQFMTHNNYNYDAFFKKVGIVICDSDACKIITNYYLLNEDNLI